MNTINIEIIDIDVVSETKGKNTWEVGTVTYKDLQFKKVDAKKVVSFGLTEGWEILKESKKGDLLSVEREKSEPNKEGKQFWNWKKVGRQTEQPEISGEKLITYKQGTTTRSGNWETPEERAARQVMIVRQSSISSAVDLVKDHGKQPDVGLVLSIAKQFENFVMGNGIEYLTSDEVE